MTVFTGLILVILSFWLGYQCSLYILSQRIIANPQILVGIVEKLDKQLEEKEIKKLKEEKNRQKLSRNLKPENRNFTNGKT